MDLNKILLYPRPYDDLYFASPSQIKPHLSPPPPPPTPINSIQNIPEEWIGKSFEFPMIIPRAFICCNFDHNSGPISAQAYTKTYRVKISDLLDPSKPHPWEINESPVEKPPKGKENQLIIYGNNAGANDKKSLSKKRTVGNQGRPRADGFVKQARKIRNVKPKKSIDDNSKKVIEGILKEVIDRNQKKDNNTRLKKTIKGSLNKREKIIDVKLTKDNDPDSKKKVDSKSEKDSINGSKKGVDGESENDTNNKSKKYDNVSLKNNINDSSNKDLNMPGKISKNSNRRQSLRLKQKRKRELRKVRSMERKKAKTSEREKPIIPSNVTREKRKTTRPEKYPQ
ncbi:hypothetical protein DASC09_041690 [Saccharomycopsis crataegensis]|uniref:Uncharacterized protein n=1 Tax=Saccharomycopsis crataegensis TaxID=43959 RepID=A0AAV5QQ60_9ASCO|nr:hypothetical protein DASC09_041690 [Saccharomycopsis crataegensis]